MDASVADDPVGGDLRQPSAVGGTGGGLWGHRSGSEWGYGIVLARRFGAAAVVEGPRVRAAHATVVALVFGAIVGAGAAIGVALGWSQPYWVPERYLLLLSPCTC